MRPEIKRLHYIFAGVSFVVALLTYLLTMQPTIPFWDCGEFAAAAGALQIPHPPGAPLWTLVGRLGMLVPLFTDPVARYNFLSVLSSAGSILLLYLTLVHFIRIWRGTPETITEAIITLGGAFIGALAYTWTDSFWFNALECEVYAFGSLFISLALWLMMVWYDRADEPHHERYLLLIAYVIGLSLGVHQLALLTMFPVFMIVYYRRRNDQNVTLSSWFGMVGASVLLFGVTFVLILSKLVEWAGKGQGVLSVIVLAALIAGIIWSTRQKKSTISLSLWAVMLVFLGYTTYGFVMVRASQNPPMNQNAPSTFGRLAGYINRDQYGSWQLFPRRLEDQKPSHPQTWEDYSSSADFFWRYQTNIMYHRYLGWNFIGRTSDEQGAGVDASKTWAIPFLIGLFGFYWHFRKDPKRALTLLGAFIILGYLVDWYQNQQDPQPRERDYFYVGAFYIFAMWVGIGATGIMELIRDKVRGMRETSVSPAILGAFVLLLIVGPINLCFGLAGMVTGQPFSKSSKWAEYSRKNNWVPWEYAYDILQSCEPNAILFTYGDNDTFPLWCMQDVYAIRRDVRIVQLQLAQMMWYDKQLKTDNDWGAKAVKLSIFNDDLVNMPDDEAYSHMNFHPDPVSLSVPQQNAQWLMGTPKAEATVFNWTPQVRTPSDLIVMDIVQNNLATRPIYYSVTVPENSRAGLNKFLVYEGLAARVTPYPQPADPTGLGGSIQEERYTKVSYGRPANPVATPSRGMFLYTYSDPHSNTSAMDDAYSMTYRFQFVRLASWYLNQLNSKEASRALDTMEARVPVARIPLDYPYASIISDLAEKSGNFALSKKYAEVGARAMEQVMKDPNWREDDRYAKQISPDYEYANLLMKAGRLNDAESKFRTLRSQSQPGQQAFLQLKIDEVEARKLEAANDYAGAYRKFSGILEQYRTSGSGSPGDLLDLEHHAQQDAAKAGLKDTAFSGVH